MIERDTDDQQERKLLSVTQAREMFFGPLPYPDHLAAYERITPGLADRIVAMAEDTNRVNILNERAITNAKIQYRQSGLYGGIVALVIILGSSVGAAHIGHPKLDTSKNLSNLRSNSDSMLV